MITPPAVDSHAHVFDRRFPFAPGAHYIPDHSQQGQPNEFWDLIRIHGFSHGLLVGALPYAFDNRAMLSAIREAGGRFKGIALVPPDISDKDLTALADGGVVGFRINLMFYGVRELQEPGAERLFARAKEMGWFLQLHCETDNVADAAPLLKKTGLRLVFDHFGRPDPAKGVGQAGFQAMLNFGREGRHVVKLSGPFRSSQQPYPYTDIEPFIAAAAEAFTLDNCVWGSDWPFVLTESRIDYTPPLTCLERWFPNEADRRKILWDSPSRLFGFRPL
ncbi:MAG: amidohydrolase family protein [Variibacter sp.]|nr:amidohydrolase family protein [Variibacter sp.]